MNVWSLLFLRWSKVLCTISSGNGRNHHILSLMELPPHESKELSPKREAVGICGMMNAIGVSNFIPESSSRACRMKSNSSRIVSLTLYKCLLLLMSFAANFSAKLISFAMSAWLPTKCFRWIWEMRDLMWRCLKKSLVVLQCEAKGRVDMRHQFEDPWSTFAEAGNFAD